METHGGGSKMLTHWTHRDARKKFLKSGQRSIPKILADDAIPLGIAIKLFPGV